MNLIEIHNLSKTFGKKSRAINHLHLSIPAGAIFGIIGMSGAGKSTLLRCLTGLETADSGTISIEGKLITPANIPFLRQQMGMVFQHFQLFSSRTAAKNIAYPLEIRGVNNAQIKERVTELLELIGLSSKKDHYPSQLSGGEKQRIGIARALAHQPKLLLCDEPTSALDAKSTRSILALLQSLNQKLGITIILITHQLETVKQICQRVAVLSHGEIVEEGSVLEVFTAPQHLITQQLLHLGVDQIPKELLGTKDPAKKIVRLGFKGENAKQPIISQLIKNFDVEVNILGGGLDYLQRTLVGSLFVELSGHPDRICQALEFLNLQKVQCEELK